MIYHCKYSITYTHPENDPPHELAVLYECLEKSGITITKHKPNSNGFHFDSFDVSEDGIEYQYIDSVIQRIKELDYLKIKQLYSVTYSNEELEKADYLMVRSVFTGFEAVNSYEVFFHDSGVVVEKDNQSFVLSEHCLQIEQPRILKGPVWRTTRQFCGSLTDSVGLYCSDYARNIIEKNGITGASFRPVYHAKTGEPIKDLWQLWPQECQDFLLPGEGVECSYCKTCGQRKYNISISRRCILYLNRDKIPANIDVFQSPPLVGATIGVPVYIMARKAYHLLKEKNIIRSLVFEPIRVRKA